MDRKGIQRMKRTSLHLGAVLALFVAVSSARADRIAWTFAGSGTGVVSSAFPGTGGVMFTYDPKSPALGPSHIAIANLWTFSEAAQTQPDLFSKAGYQVALEITDAESSQSGIVTFAGELSGALTAKSALVTNTFLGPTSQMLTLGNNAYTVALTAFVPPGPPNSSNAGAISALVTAMPITVPEPSTVVLVALGAAGLGLARWRRLRATRLAAPTA
jgi:hypothetical protein